MTKLKLANRDRHNELSGVNNLTIDAVIGVTDIVEVMHHTITTLGGFLARPIEVQPTDQITEQLPEQSTAHTIPEENFQTTHQTTDLTTPQSTHFTASPRIVRTTGLTGLIYRSIRNTTKMTGSAIDQFLHNNSHLFGVCMIHNQHLPDKKANNPDNRLSY